MKRIRRQGVLSTSPELEGSDALQIIAGSAA